MTETIGIHHRVKKEQNDTLDHELCTVRSTTVPVTGTFSQRMRNRAVINRNFRVGFVSYTGSVPERIVDMAVSCHSVLVAVVTVTVLRTKCSVSPRELLWWIHWIDGFLKT